MSSTNDGMREALDATLMEGVKVTPTSNIGPQVKADDESAQSGRSPVGAGQADGMTRKPPGQLDTLAGITQGVGMVGNDNPNMIAMAQMIQQLTSTVARLEQQASVKGTPSSEGSIVSNNNNTIAEGNGKITSTSITNKRKLGELTKFDGTKTHYLSWKLEAMSKLEYDGHLIGDAKAQLAYLFMRMKPEAQLEVRAYYQAVQVQLAYTPQLFIAYLDSVYIDPNEAGRALQELRGMEQGDRETFAAFFPKFERTMAEAQMSTESDRSKINYLEGALNQDMRLAMVGKVRTTYLEFAAELQLVGSQLEGLYQREKKSKTDRGKKGNSSSLEGKGWNGRAVANPDEKSKPPAKWATQEEMTHRREKHLCYRCGSVEHGVRECNYGPAKRPFQAKKSFPEETDSEESENVQP